MRDLVELQEDVRDAIDAYNSSPSMANARAASDAQEKVITAMQPASAKEEALGEALNNRAVYYETIARGSIAADQSILDQHNSLVKDAIDDLPPLPVQGVGKPASAGFTDIYNRTRDEFQKNRYIKDYDGKTHDSYNFWSPAGNVFRKPFDNGLNGIKNFAKDHPLIAGFTFGIIPLLVGVYEAFGPRSLWGMGKDAFKFAGNFLNAACSAAGAVINFVCKVVSGLFDNLANFFDGAAQKISDAKIPLISPLVAGVAKCISAPLHVLAKGVDKIGGVGQEVCSTAGAVCRLVSNPFAYSSLRAVGRGVTQSLANIAMVPVEMMKESGTQLKELGNVVDVPVVSQICRGAGNIVLASAVVTEGIVQGTKQFARFDNGFKSMANGFKSGAATIGLGVKEAGQDFVAKVKGDEPARELGERQTKSAFIGNVKIDQSHVVRPRSDAYEALTKETTGVLKDNLKVTYDEQAEAQKQESAEKKAARAEKAGRRL